MAELRKGDFIRSMGGNGSFYIYEGNETEAYPNAYFKRYSVIAYYDPNKYVKMEDKWVTMPSLTVAKDGKPLDRTVDSNFENSTYSILTKEEKEKAMEVLAKYGYQWDDNTLTLSRMDGTVVYQMKTPRIEYLGEEVKPINDANKRLLVKVCKSITREASCATYPNYQYQGNNYDSQYPRDYDLWD